MGSALDYPKSLKETRARKQKIAKLNTEHIEPLTRFVEEIRKETGFGEKIPYFDPDDGGISARCLFLLEAPGPKSVESGFVSRNNPDETAKTFFELNQQVGLPREITVTWNIVPWYIGSGKKIRPAKSQDISEGINYLNRLLALLTKLELVILVGKKAQRAEDDISKYLPDVELINMYHPSPMFVNRAPSNRNQVLGSLRQVAEFLSHEKGNAP
ncbi:MAG: uracil-DNA glycosylase [Chloroflexi bacterium]|nr:uracil-DNA glycosylase [Chloroflexota bacterium]